MSTERGDLRTHAGLNTDPAALDVPTDPTIPLTVSPCGNVVGELAPFNPTDMQADPNLAMLPAAKDMGAKTYFGLPVLLPDGSFFGAFAALDTASQPLTEDKTHAMQELARLAGTQLQRQRAAHAAA